MEFKVLRSAIDYVQIINRKYGWRECTTKERCNLIAGIPLPTNVYKILNIKATKKGITFFLWFDNDEVIEVICNEYACDAYDVTDCWEELICK